MMLAVRTGIFLLFTGTLAPALGQSGPPSAVTPQEKKARDFFKDGKFEEALKQLLEATKANPKLPPARIMLANMFLQVGNGQDFRFNLERAAAEDPKHPDVYLTNGSIALREGRITEAILNCQVSLQLAADPRWDGEQRKRFVREARQGLAASFEARGDWAMVRDQVTALLAEEPTNAMARTRLARALFNQDKPDQAFAELQTAHKDDPAIDLPELQMYMLYFSKADNARAEEWLKKAIANYPKQARVFRAYAGYHLELGQLDAAAPLIESAVKLEPDHRDTLLMRGLYARHRKDLQTAETLYERLLREQPGDSRITLSLALVLADSDDPVKKKRAIELAEGEVRKSNRNTEALAVLGWAYLRTGRDEDAERAVLSAVQAGPLSRDATYFLCKTLVARGRPDEAARILKPVIENARGGFVYESDARALLAEIEKTPKK